MRWGIMTDLHLGGTGCGRWHNRLVYEQAEAIARTAVAALNAENLDAVYVLGDITESGADPQLELARTILSELQAPWFVVPGNHDRGAVRSGRFEAVLGDHALPGFAIQDGIAIAALRGQGSVTGETADRYRLDETEVATLLDRLCKNRPDTLFLFSHQPLAANAAWAAGQGGKDAGYYRDGRALLEQAIRLTGRVAAFCGHQHWHHLATGPGWLQCATAALIEYPMEARLVTGEGRTLNSRILPVAPGLAATSLDGAPWVRGRDTDREWTQGFARSTPG